MTDKENSISVNIGKEKVYISFFYDRKNDETMFSGNSDYLNVKMVGLNDIDILQYTPRLTIPLGGVDVDNAQKASVLHKAATMLLEKYYAYMSGKDT